MKPQMTKTSQDNNLNYINISRHFYEYHTEKLKYRDENEKNNYMVLEYENDLSHMQYVKSSSFFCFHTF